MQEVTIGLALIAGILSFISPCVLPLIPAYVGYMGGRMTRTVAVQTASGKNSQLGNQSLTSRVSLIVHSASFVLGFTTVFVVLGLITTGIISALGGSGLLLTDIIGRVGGVIIILFGLHFMGVVPVIFRWLRAHPALLNSPVTSLAIGIAVSAIILWGFVILIIALPVLAGFWLALALNGAFTRPGDFWNQLMDGFERIFYTDTRQQINPNSAGGLGGSFFMGIVFAAGWTPCIGPIYGAILNTAIATQDIGAAATGLAAYSLGLGIPFMLTALLLESAQGVLKRLQRHMRAIELVSGSFLILIGVLVASGQLQSLSTRLSSGEFADFTFRVEECTVGLAQGDLTLSHLGSCYSGTLEPIVMNQGIRNQLTVDSPEHQYVLRIEETARIDVELSRLEGLEPVVTMYQPDDVLAASSSTLEQVEEDTYLVLNHVTVTPGLYRVAITGSNLSGEPQRYQLRIVKTEPEAALSLPDDASAESPLIDLAETGRDALTARNAEIGLEIGNLAPDFSAMSITGEAIALSNFEGKITIINFWGSWCGPCRREMPILQELYEVYENQGMTIVGLAVNDTLEDVEAFRDEFDLTFPLALDNGSSISNLYNITSQPSTLIVDADGVIVFKHFGLVTREQIEPAIQNVLTS